MQRSADVATSVLAEMLSRQPMTPGKLQFAWRAAVGPSLARASTLDFRDGRVIVRMSSPEWTREIQRLKPIVLERLRTILGRDTISRIDVI